MTDSENSNNDSADSSDTDPKIIVDGDWKEQVAKEKEALEGGANDETSDDSKSTDESSNDDFVPKQVNFDDEEIPPPPPATFEILISMMFTQAMSMLGHIPDPTGSKIPVNKPYAKHTIDTLEMLGEKTKGNLTDDEANMLGEALHALRMAYVDTKA